jgi:phosphoglycerate dehydrogenase-like enzyme
LSKRHQALICAKAFRNAGPEPRRLLAEGGCELIDSPREGTMPPDELVELIADVDGVIAGNELFGEEVFAAARRLRAVSRWGIGVDRVDLDAATRHGVVVTNTPRLTATGVADYTFALLLASARRVLEADRAVRTAQWQDMVGADVWQQCLGLVGFGAIGQAVAHRARGFEMRVLAYDPNPNQEAARELGVAFVPLEQLLREADFVSLHATATDENQGMIGSREFALMKPSAFLVNMARGSLVDEAALVQALRGRQIAGAALDVHAEEPTDTEYALLAFDNCVLSPHTASMSRGTIAAVSRQAALNLLAVLRGERPESVVNPEVYDEGRLKTPNVPHPAPPQCGTQDVS